MTFFALEVPVGVNAVSLAPGFGVAPPSPLSSEQSRACKLSEEGGGGRQERHALFDFPAAFLARVVSV